MNERAAEPIRMKHRVEYGLLRILGCLFRLLPLRLSLGVAWAVAWISHWVLRFRVAEARSRIRQVFGDAYGDREVRRIAWQAWRNLCFCVVDILRLPGKTLEQVASRVVNMEEMERLRSLSTRDGGEGQGVVLAVPHLGAWDLAGIACHLQGIPMFFIARRQKNPLVDDYLNQMRGSTGVETVLNDSRVLQGVIRRLRAGKVMAILPDVRAPTVSLPIPFLGGTANIGGGMALFARRADVPILPAYVVREGWTRHRYAALDPVIPDPRADKRADWLRMTTEVMHGFDEAIRAHPEQYFWFNKRWVLDPLPDRPPEPAPAEPQG